MSVRLHRFHSVLDRVKEPQYERIDIVSTSHPLGSILSTWPRPIHLAGAPPPLEERKTALMMAPGLAKH